MIPTTPDKVRFWLPMFSLWQREMVRFLRQKHRVVSALLTPVLFWLMLGMGFGSTFTYPSSPRAESPNPASAQPAEEIALAPLAADSPSISYVTYFFPGMLGFMILSTAVYSTVTIIEDRREGFLQGILTAPVSRLAIVMGKVLGGATIATMQGWLLLLLWPMVGASAQSTEASGIVSLLPGMLQAMGVLAILAVGMTGLGLCLAWPMQSSAGFHAVMMILLMPMWFLSGAVFPMSQSSPWLMSIMLANPLSHGQAALAGVLTGRADLTGSPVGIGMSLAITVVLTLCVLLLASYLVQKPRKDGLA